MYNLLRPINFTSFGYVLLILAVVAIIFTALILIISKYCAVSEDPKIAQVQDKLSGANCGGCGYAGCADFAKAIVEGRADVNCCSATSNANKKQIAEVLGVEVTESVPMVAVVKCAGANGVAVKKFDYVGNSGCDAKNACLGGDKLCPSGCLGEGSCAIKCTHDAIKIVDGVAYIDKSLCGGCSACAKVCPKHIIELIPKSASVYVACSSKCKGKEVMSACSVGCIGCSLCVKACPLGAIVMENNLPVIDYNKCTGCKTCVAKCPKKVIKEL